MGKHRAPRPTLAAAVTDRAGRAVEALPSGTVLGAAALGALGAASAVLAPAGALAADGPVAAPRRDGALVRVPDGARFAAPTDRELAALRHCESTSNYGIATGNGFYGAYQFDLGTWRGLGLSGYPHEASAPLQDAAAAALEQSRGWQPWPSCSAQLGLVPRRANAVPVAAVLAPAPGIVRTTSTGRGTADTLRRSGSGAGGLAPERSAPDRSAAGKHRKPLGGGPTAVVQAPAPRHSSAVPAYRGTVLSVADVATYRADVRLWQERMVQRGWNLAPDGYFGPRSQAVARAFADEKGVVDALPGEVGPLLWAASWSAPISR